MLRVSTLGLAILLTVACTPGKHGDEPGTAPPPPPQKTVFDPLTQQLERARGVQKSVDQNADDTRKAIDNQERGDTPR